MPTLELLKPAEVMEWFGGSLYNCVTGVRQTAGSLESRARAKEKQDGGAGLAECDDVTGSAEDGVRHGNADQGWQGAADEE